ncbi:Hsp20/alpha crystallin family protein [Halorientalis marina]|uniref:Hsp20/alpha crystallin family protein n=1 Tax=Halorientalis marina TaxID=2931976 RepID=UPI001FF275E2|nr:Hsp20/alpha crystallin family protein [Halorientalis marina]
MTDHQLDHEIELYREDDHYVVLMEMADYDREDLDLTWHDNRLHIEAHHVDTGSGRSQVLQRSLSFPKEIDEDGITAASEGGTLEVELPIAAEERDPGQSIEIDG